MGNDERTGEDGAAKCLELDVICYNEFTNNNPETMEKLRRALLEKGIVGMKNIPNYDEKVTNYISALKEFMSLPEETKLGYSPDESSMNFLGYEKGKEQFLLRKKKKNNNNNGPNDGNRDGDGGAEEDDEEEKKESEDWVVDDLKNSFYVHIPDTQYNKWPKEINLKDPSIALGECMSQMGTMILESMGVVVDRAIESSTKITEDVKNRIDITNVPRVGRMLYYSKLKDTQDMNPYWCGEHFDHGLFTALIPAKYYDASSATGNDEIEEPFEAGLHVRCPEDVRNDASGGSFQKVVVPPVSSTGGGGGKMIMMFQVGEFGQLYTDDVLLATEHRVSKPTISNVERYTMALFFDIPQTTFVRSKSVLTSDSRYHGGRIAGEDEASAGCSYGQWSKRSFERYSIANK